MKAYAQLWHIQEKEWSCMDERMIKLETPYLVRGLGTDSYMRIDRRLSRQNMIRMAQAFMMAAMSRKPWVRGVRVILTDSLQHDGRIIYQMDVGMEYREDKP